MGRGRFSIGRPWAWGLGALGAVLLMVGWLVPGNVECDAAQPHAEPGGAIDLSRQFTSGTIGNVLYRKRCVAEIREVPGSCTWREALADRDADDVARVEMHTWGGITRDLYVTCSGVSVFPPTGWDRSPTTSASRRLAEALSETSRDRTR